MPLIPYSLLFRVAYRCGHVKNIPGEHADRLLDLPEICRIDNLAALDEGRRFADLRMAWNDFGVGVQVEVRGKEQEPAGNAGRLRSSDGLTLWIDTRDARTSHRASRYCHQFHFLPTGGGPDNDEPVFSQVKIHRALQDAPLGNPRDVPFRCERLKNGYVLEAFLPPAALTGFDPEQNARLGFFYVVRDAELGEQYLSLNADFPYGEDPSLWSVLELVR